MWYHGDYLVINPATGGIVMLGRSDGTLNPGGVRFGSAEIYNVLASVPEIADSLVVGQKQGSDERVVLFVKLAEGHALTPSIEEHIRFVPFSRRPSTASVPGLTRSATAGRVGETFVAAGFQQADPHAALAAPRARHHSRRRRHSRTRARARGRVA